MVRFKVNIRALFILNLVIFVLLFSTKVLWANLYLNVVAVNGTDEAKEKEIHAVLPRELTADDIIDTDGLRLEYDVEASAYMVLGNIQLGPKETKTFKILIKDLWRFEDDQVNKIFDQIDTSLKQLKGSEYFKAGKIKTQVLKQRLDFVQRSRVFNRRRHHVIIAIDHRTQCFAQNFP